MATEPASPGLFSKIAAFFKNLFGEEEKWLRNQRRKTAIIMTAAVTMIVAHNRRNNNRRDRDENETRDNRDNRDNRNNRNTSSDDANTVIKAVIIKIRASKMSKQLSLTIVTTSSNVANNVLSVVVAKTKNVNSKWPKLNKMLSKVMSKMRWKRKKNNVRLPHVVNVAN